MTNVEGISRPLPVTFRGDVRWRRPVAVAVVATADALSAVVTMVVASSFAGLAGYQPFDEPIIVIAGAAALLLCLHQLLGFYDGSRSNPVERFRDRVLAALIFSTPIAIMMASHVPLPLAIVAFALLSCLQIVTESITSAVARQLLVNADLWREPVLLIGADEETSALAKTLDAAPDGAFRPVAVFTPEAWSAATAVRPGVGRESIGLRNHSDTFRHVECALLVSSGDQRRDMQLAAEIDLPSVIILREIGALQTLWLQPRSIGNAFGIEVRRSLLVARNLRLKRAFDLVVAVPLAIACLPIIAAGALAIFLVNPGNPFYSQLRIGQNLRPFRVWKLRSMYRDAEPRLAAQLATNPAAQREWLNHFKLSRDPRILPIVGALARRSSLDELPQLLNVLRGEMSLVGPRPFPDYHLASFDREFYRLRASVTPGLSGLWQITERSNADLSAQKRLDTFYIRNWSIWLDFWILMHTLPAIVMARGAR